MDKMLIHQLAEQARTTIRTIRYYTDEGLLPQPVIQGRYAYYTQNHLDRLELIRRMKDAYLPLREIRQVMISLSDEDVRQRLIGESASNSKVQLDADRLQPASGTGSKALEYISRLMEGQKEYRSDPSPLSPRLSRVEIKDEILASSNVTAEASNKPLNEECWQRISLAPGVELHLRLPADSDKADRIQQLTAFAKKLFRSI